MENSNTILNYPGSKRRLLDFIYENTKELVGADKVVLDIFAGTGCVAEMYKNKGYNVATNDTEIYSCNIANALLNGFNKKSFSFDCFYKNYEANYKRIAKDFNKYIKNEPILSIDNIKEYIKYEDKLPKIWNLPKNFKLNNIKIDSIDDLNKQKDNIPFVLFSLYYSGSYFGIKQAFEIDSLRYAIEQESKTLKPTLFTCLYYAMKECTFSKDGHMAQPLNPEKNTKKLVLVREKDIFDLFKNKFDQLSSISSKGKKVKVYNKSFLELIFNDKYLDDIDLIYADPPYTDMQYSRYFHLLTTITNYEYPKLTEKGGKLTSGLYANNRFQSSISSRSTALKDLTLLIEKASSKDISLVFSYGFPIDRENQPIDRYTMDIKDLITAMKNSYDNVQIIKENFKHCNNRNSEAKKVFEYLIIGTKKDFKISNDTNLNSLDKVRKEIDGAFATNKSPLYNSMLYWSQKPYNITDILLENFSSTNDVVMDPFMGSGVTLLEAAKKKYNRKAIGIDINDMPIFLCKESVKDISQKTINNLLKYKDKIEKYQNEYHTICPKCGNSQAKIKKIIYDLEPSFQIKEFSYECCSSKPLLKDPSVNDIKLFNKERKIENINNIPLIENSRIAVKKGEKISDKFSKRSFWALDKIKELINQEADLETKESLLYIYASIIHKTKILDVKLSSQWPLWIPKKNCVERNVFDIFKNAIDKYIESRKYTKDSYNSKFVNDFDSLQPGEIFIKQKGIQYINDNEIPSKSVDLIITDPPYLGQVPYSEYMQLYQPFLENNIDYNSEIVMTNAKGQEKDYEEYMLLMKTAFKNISRMLKDNAKICLYFHDSNLKVWSDLFDIFEISGFSFIASIHIDKKQKTLKKLLDPKKTMSGETLLVLEKTNNNKTIMRQVTESDISKLEILANEIIRNSKDGYCTTSQLYDKGVLEYMIKEGILEDFASKYKDLVDFFEEILSFDTSKGVWKEKTAL